MPKECKKYRIRHTRKPAQNCLLSSVVKVIDENGIAGYCYVGFDAPLIDLVGRKLSRGVAPFDPAYLMLEYDRIRKLWLVGVRYLMTEEYAHLWETAEKPDWLKKVYSGGTHASAQKNKNTGSKAGRSNAGAKDADIAGSTSDETRALEY